MNVSFVGIICILLSLITIWNEKRMFFLCITFAPLVTCAVIQTNSFYLQPGHFFLSLFFVREFVTTIAQNKRLIKPDRTIIGFIFAVILSIVFSLIFKYDALVYGIGNKLQLKSSNVSVQNITQLMYLLTCILLHYLVRNYCNKNEERHEYLRKAVVFSGFLVTLIGLYQMLANNFELPFQTIFRNDLNGMWQTMNRVQSTMGEASNYGQFCSLLLPIYLWDDWLRRKKWFRIVLILIDVITGIASRSTTYFISVIIIVTVSILFSSKTRKHYLRNLAVIIFIAIASLYLYSDNELFALFIDSAIGKFRGVNISSIERNHIFKDMFHIGILYPLFGVGYGSGRSTDMYTSLFATTGIIGLVLFLTIIIRNIISPVLFQRKTDYIESFLIVVTLLTTFITCPDINLLYIWVFILIAEPRFTKKTIINRRKIIS